MSDKICTTCVRSLQMDAPVFSYMFLIWRGWNNPRNTGMPFKIRTFSIVMAHQFTRLLPYKWKLWISRIRHVHHFDLTGLKCIWAKLRRWHLLGILLSTCVRSRDEFSPLHPDFYKVVLVLLWDARVGQYRSPIKLLTPLASQHRFSLRSQT